MIVLKKYIYYRKTVCLAVLLALVTLAGSAGAGIAANIDDLAERTKRSYDNFMQQTFISRMSYEYHGRFINEASEENLGKPAQKTSDQLAEILEIQKALKKRIELHKDDDWEDKFGATGLWRKLFADLQNTLLTKCHVDYYLAAASKPAQKHKILEQILTQIDSLDINDKSTELRFLKASVTADLSRSDLTYKPSAISQLNLLAETTEAGDPIYFRVRIEKIKLLGRSGPGQLKKLVALFEQSGCTDDIELILSLTFLQRRLKYPDAIERMIGKWPQTEQSAGSLLLEDIAARIKHNSSLDSLSLFEAELAAETLWREQGNDYSYLLQELAGRKQFQTPFILYSAAFKLVKKEPHKAVELLINASAVQQHRKSRKLGIGPETIARQAAQLAYNQFAENPKDGPLAIRAFDNYRSIAAAKLDEEIEYLYAGLFADCGMDDRSMAMTEAIAARNTGQFRNRAALDLILQKSAQTHDLQTSHSQTLAELRELIENCDERNQIDVDVTTEAVKVYCQLLAESDDAFAAQKVLEILDETEITDDPEFNIFKSRAFRKLGKMDKAVTSLLWAVDQNDCSQADDAVELLTELTDKIDELTADYGNSSVMMRDCQKLAEFCYHCRQTPLTALYLAEITILTATDENELAKAEKILTILSKKSNRKNVNLIRCRARLLGKQNKFDDAAKLWTEVCDIQKKRTVGRAEQNWKWWRAKYYQLRCGSQLPATEKNKVSHAVDVLENTFKNIPPLWLKKLRRLKYSK